MGEDERGRRKERDVLVVPVRVLLVDLHKIPLDQRRSAVPVAVQSELRPKLQGRWGAHGGPGALGEGLACLKGGRFGTEVSRSGETRNL
eukprot:746604-Hanusia_phi.AAC.1